ncbi:hypothetical protein AWB76_07494 [Caballeronia temeraria]|uniref:Uncharacterized protein n=1 Tax=Caballeronia temeraria TaxID=1777137 RepID=A0A158DUP2_9BURK|nr:hypothetical protein AWB76_07494 [Caballeronia temeraria]
MGASERPPNGVCRGQSYFFVTEKLGMRVEIGRKNFVSADCWQRLFVRTARTARFAHVDPSMAELKRTYAD